MSAPLIVPKPVASDAPAVLSAPAGVVGFQLLKNCEAAASSRSLFVIGAVYENCMMCSRPSCFCVDSGDQVPNPYTATQSSPRTRHASASFAYELPLQTY